MIRSSTYQKNKFLFLYGMFVGIWVFYGVISQFVATWIIVIQTIFFSYLAACFLLKENLRQIVHSFSCIVILFIFRIDYLILESVFTKILTELTTIFLFLILKYGDSIFLIWLFLSMCVFQSLRKEEMKFTYRWFSICVISALLIISFIFHFSSEKVLLIDATTIQMENSSRISIVDSCSGIYGLIIFLSSFIFFVNVTKTNRKFTFDQIMLSGTVGIIGVYSLNLFRILILILLTLYIPAKVWSETHIYLGAIFIIGYLTIFWGIIWSKLPLNSS